MSVDQLSADCRRCAHLNRDCGKKFMPLILTDECGHCDGCADWEEKWEGSEAK